MGTDKYILKDGVPVPCDDLLEWGRWMQTAKRHVALDWIGDVKVSTVFLGLDHQFASGPPLIYETMVFGGPLDQNQDRYSTREEAEQGHQKMVELVKASVKETAQ
jgi:hypothetical protein